MALFATLNNFLLLALVGLLALGVPLIAAPLDEPQWHGLRSASFEAGAVLLLAMLVTQPWTRERRTQWMEAGKTLPLRLLAALFVWECLSALLAPPKAFAVQGLLLWGAGIIIAWTIAAEGRARPQFELLLHALTGATLLISLTGLDLLGTGKLPLAVGLYSDHGLFGAVFTVLLPIMLAVSLSPLPPLRRLPAQCALVCGLAALGLSETRSSWIGFAGSLLVFAGLWFFARAAHPREPVVGAERRRQRMQGFVSGLFVLGALVYFVTAGPQIGDRLRTFVTTVPQGKEASVQWRFTAWQGARDMVRQKPWLGWGIGCYPFYQYRFTGMGHNAGAIQTRGPTIFDEAHNSYLQVAAELGLPGLLLWLGVLISAMAPGLRSLRRPGADSLRSWALIGCLSALVGQAVDALANPGWQFGEVSLFLWITLGLTVTLALGPPQKGDSNRSEYLAEARPRILSAGKFLAATMMGIGLMWVILQTMCVLPSPKL